MNACGSEGSGTKGQVQFMVLGSLWSALGELGSSIESSVSEVAGRNPAVVAKIRKSTLSLLSHAP